MLFSTSFGIALGPEDDWFDPILTLDTPLFIDPFLIYDNEFDVFEGSHQEIIDFFNCIFGLIAKSGGQTTDQKYRQALAYLELPEVDELCIGYTSKGTKGSGSGLGLARAVAAAIGEAIGRGVREITHFEEIALLREGIGADRISDTTAGLLRWRLAEYTRSICESHGVPTKITGNVRGKYDLGEGRWRRMTVDLPVNPNNGRPVMLVPKVYLRKLPTISADDFWNYCVTYENELLRSEYSRDVLKHVTKKLIIQLARAHPEVRRQYIEHTEHSASVPYDFTKDQSGIVAPYYGGAEYARCNPLHLEVGAQEDFARVVSELVHDFKHCVQDAEGWELLWNDDHTPRGEAAAQGLFKAIVSGQCRANNIDLTREADVGCGSVDFRVTRGYQLRTVMEVKLANNTGFWNGLKVQLPAYMTSDRVDCGYFIVIVYSDSDARRVRNISEITNDVARSTQYDIKSIVVDARPKLSASKRRLP